MAWQKTTYPQVRSKMKPGDVIAFGGKGDFSRIIKWATRSAVSHVGVILQSKMIIDGKPQPGYFNEIIESTTLNGFSGVSTSRLSACIKRYKGEVWWLPLSPQARKKFDTKRFFDWCLHQKSKPYDMPQAIKSALDLLDDVPFISGATRNKEDFDKFFCSELVAAGLKKGRVIKRINSSEVTPIDLCRFKLYSATHYRLKAAKQPKRKPEKMIHGYNSLDPEGFGM